MSTVGSVSGLLMANCDLHAAIYNPPLVNGKYPICVQVSLNRAAKPGRIAFKRDGSILRTYRLGRLSRAPQWVRDVADDVMAGAL